MTTVTGLIDNPEPIRSHDDYPTTFSGPSLTPGVPTQLLIRGAKNTGNVAQTISVAITNLVGVEVTAVQIETGNTWYDHSAVINPGFYAPLYVTVKAPDVGYAEDEQYSFDIVANWS